MLNKISWSSFEILLVLVLIGYYLYVLIIYYRKEIFSIGTINRKSIAQNTRSGNSPEKKTTRREMSSLSETPSAESFTIVHELLEDLKELFLKASRIKMVREELIQAIRTKLKTYPGIEETDLLDDINRHIIMEAKDKCDLEILPGDIKQIWE